MDAKNPQVAVKLVTDKWKSDQKAVKLKRTKELVAKILGMSRELNDLVNAAGNVSSAVKTN